jgi:uncharacterized protein YndB with AHSA1/START domain
MSRTINKVSSEAVEKATGRGWDQWIAFIDQHGGDALDHKGIVALVGGEGRVESSWWQQQVTVGYEHAKNRRVTGQTADQGFQIGVQRVIPMARETLWKFLTGAAGRKLWLGTVRRLALESGATYETEEGASGEVRTVRPGERLRLTYKLGSSKRTTTLQITLSCVRNDADRTTLRFHHEKLANAKERERMKAHWKNVADAIHAQAERRRQG